MLCSSEREIPETIEGLKSLVLKQNEHLEFYKSEVSFLRENIRQLKKQAFGPRRERWLSTGQLSLFNEAEEEAKKHPQPQKDKTVDVKGHLREDRKKTFRIYQEKLLFLMFLKKKSLIKKAIL